MSYFEMLMIAPSAIVYGGIIVSACAEIRRQ